MFVGEGPGEEEDRQGLAFVGAAGQLLTKMIEAMGLTREEVFIGNIVKCRPPNNRQPTAEEMQTCIPYLERQIEILKPRIIVALGATAMKGLMRVETGITRLRGTWMSYRGIDLMPTFHPAYLLRYPPAKHDAWKDLQDVLARLGRRPPPRPGRK
jgi:DNA polymerase